MKNVSLWLFMISVLVSFNHVRGQDTKAGVEDLLDRINKEVPVEGGCSEMVFSYEDCTLKCALVCGGNEFMLSFKMSDIERVYKDKADFDDPFETLFFECKEGDNCVKSDSDQIPPSPVFPVRLPEPGDETSTFGDEALKVFQAAIDQCK